MSGRSVVVQGSSVEKADDVVVFLPPAGSVTSPYFPIGTHLPATLAAVHCEVPGRGRLVRDEAPASVQGAVDRWTEDLAALLPGRRLHLFGHSLGALFAYELSTRFEEQSGYEVASLLVSGAREPGNAPRPLIATAFAALRGQQRATDREGDTEGSWLFKDLQMRREYQITKQQICASLALLGGSADKFVRPDEMGEWKRFTSGPFLGTFTFDGGHDYYLSGQDLVAAAISRIVDRSQNSTHTGSEK